MGKRPRLNLSGSYFKDSYLAEIECLNTKVQLVRSMMAQLMDQERKENRNVREYLEQAYRLLYANIKSEWKYLAPD